MNIDDINLKLQSDAQQQMYQEEEEIKQRMYQAEEEIKQRRSTIDNILTERGITYGDFKTHARITQQLKAMMMQGQSFRNFTTTQWEALEMIAHKIGRIVNGDPSYIDSWRDISAYAKLVVDELQETDGATDGVVTNITRKDGKWS